MLKKNRKVSHVSTINRTSSSSSSQRSSRTSSSTRTSSSSRTQRTQRSSSTRGSDRTSISREASKPQGNNPVNFGAWAQPSASSAPVGNLRQGAQGPEVKKLQEALNAKGAQLDVDGKFGPKTLDAVRKFQGSNSLDVDGVAGKDTMSALNGGAAQPKADAPGGQAPGQQPGGQAAPAGSGEAPGAKKVGGTEDTKWAEKLPPKLREHAQAFIDAGKKYGVDPRFLAAISMQETGGGKSSAFRNKNNAMGISGKGGPKRFESVGQSIDVMARTLAKPNGYYKGKSTIAQIGKVYAPVGAANDPRGLNRHWIPNISNNFRMFGGDPSQAVK